MAEATAASFGDLLREYRLAAGLTQEQLAERANVSLPAIGALERGTRQRPYRATIALLADALSLTASDRRELERAAQRSSPAVSEQAHDAKAATNLPVHLSSFVGRERDLAKVAEMLATQRLVTLVGAGGVGKTRLAVRAAENFITAHSAGDKLDGLWFVDLAAVVDSQMTMSVIASSVGMKQCRTMDALLAYLRSQRYLLILDNCEHLIDEAAQVASALLGRCSNAQILATSRQALGLDGERIYRVSPLSIPRADMTLSISQALEFGAIRLFADRAEAVDSNFTLSESIIPPVADICRRLDGIALAIELAAARTNAFSTSTIAQRLDAHFLIFAGRIHPSLSRHRTMEAVFDWSYDLLDQRERNVFRRLSVFVGGFSLELATSLWAGEIEADRVVEILASLVEKSLVQCELYDGPPRYKMLEPARQYAREKLRENGEYNAAARAHANALLALAEDFDSRLKITPDHVWDAYVEPEYENFRAAIEWALGPEGDTGLAQRLAGSRCAMWCGYGSGGMQKWIRSALETCDETTSSHVRAKLELVAALTAALFELDAERLLTVSQRALLHQQAGDLRAVSTAKYFVGHALRLAGRLDEAETTLREARAAAGSCRAQSEYALVTQALATVRFCAGDLDDARTLLVETLGLERAAGSDRHAASAMVTLAEVEFATGHIERAVQAAEEAVEFYKTHADFVHLSWALSNLSAYLIAIKRYEEARRHARDGLRSLRAIGTSRTLAWTLQHIAAIAVLSNDRRRDNPMLARSAKLIGFVDWLVGKTAFPRDHTEQEEYEKMLSALREAFDEDELAEFMNAGKEWSEDQAVTEALAM